MTTLVQAASVLVDCRVVRHVRAAVSLAGSNQVASDPAAVVSQVLNPAVVAPLARVGCQAPAPDRRHVRADCPANPREALQVDNAPAARAVVFRAASRVVVPLVPADCRARVPARQAVLAVYPASLVEALPAGSVPAAQVVDYLEANLVAVAPLALVDCRVQVRVHPAGPVADCRVNRVGPPAADCRADNLAAVALVGYQVASPVARLDRVADCPVQVPDRLHVREALERKAAAHRAA